MLLTLGIIFFAVWLVGLALLDLAQTAIRMLIVLSVVALVFRLVWGHSARASVTLPATPGTGR